MTLLTFADGTAFTCLDTSVQNSISFEYDKNTFMASMDLFTPTNLNSALLEKYNDNNEILTTDYITNKKVANVKIDNYTNVVTLELTKMSTTESKIATLESNIESCLSSIDILMSMLFE